MIILGAHSQSEGVIEQELAKSAISKDTIPLALSMGFSLQYFNSWILLMKAFTWLIGNIQRFDLILWHFGVSFRCRLPEDLGERICALLSSWSDIEDYPNIIPFSIKMPKMNISIIWIFLLEELRFRISDSMTLMPIHFCRFAYFFVWGWKYFWCAWSPKLMFLNRIYVLEGQETIGNYKICLKTYFLNQAAGPLFRETAMTIPSIGNSLFYTLGTKTLCRQILTLNLRDITRSSKRNTNCRGCCLGCLILY